MLYLSIPSPGSNSLELGPLTFNAYGLMIALGVMAAVTVSSKRLMDRGGDPDHISQIALWAVPAGLIGARLYHVLTDWKSFQGRWGDFYKVWEGGLGIPGGMFLGVVVGLWVVHRKKLNRPVLLDVIIPTLPLAQAIGRIGNWFNQEIFGGPTSLPWGLEIDPQYRPDEFINEETFHPTFLYEALWNLALFALMIVIDRKRILKPGRMLAIYVLGYGIGRLWIEAMRTDAAYELLGLRINIWMSAALIIGGLYGLARGRRDGDDELHDAVYAESDADPDSDDVDGDEVDTEELAEADER